MKITLILLTLAYGLNLKSQPAMTLEELMKADWKSFGKGVSYIKISKADSISASSDSFQITLKGISGKKGEPIEIAMIDIGPYISTMLQSTIRTIPEKVNSGYIRLDFKEMLKPEQFTGTVYITGDYSKSMPYTEDSLILSRIPGIISVRFVSKEEARKKYLADGNADWAKVLTENPLPNSFDFTLQSVEPTEDEINKLRSEIKSKLSRVSDISLPDIFINRPSYIYFFKFTSI